MTAAGHTSATPYPGLALLQFIGSRDIQARAAASLPHGPAYDCAYILRTHTRQARAPHSAAATCCAGFRLF